MANAKLTEYDYVCFYNAYNLDSYVELNEEIISGTKNQEDLLMEKEKYKELSNEAQEVISMILNSPNEIIQIFTPTKRIRKDAGTNVYKYLMKKFNHYKARDTIEEIKSWLRK